MAERRMFAKTIIDSDAFLDMPLSTQALYFHLSMRADDDGFINNPKKIQRMIGASDDDARILTVKNFIIPFESGVVVIKHWKIHNYIQSDRYKPTSYIEEKNQLELKVNKAYTLKDNHSDTECIHDVYTLDTQVKLDKVKLDKSYIEDSLEDNKLSSRSSSLAQTHSDVKKQPMDNQCKDEFAESEKREKENTNNQLFVTKKKVFIPPTLQEIRDYIKAEGIDINAEHFYSHYSDPDRNWKLANGKRMDNWKLAIRTWSRNNYSFASRPKTSIERRIEENKERYQGEESEAYEGPCFIGGLDEDII